MKKFSFYNYGLTILATIIVAILIVAFFVFNRTATIIVACLLLIGVSYLADYMLNLQVTQELKRRDPYQRMWRTLKAESGYRETFNMMGDPDVPLRKLMERMEKQVLEKEMKNIKEEMDYD